jgi:hemerythrin-like domain-containing protein
MPAIIDSLRQDHRTFKELLQALEEEVAVFANAERPDFEILEAIVSYFEGYPDCCHHPKEDAIFRKLKERDPVAAEQVGNLEEEHGASLRNLGRFAEAVENVLAEVDMPREAFGNVAMAFIENERHHIMMEEEKFFPVALEVLKDEDWAELDARLTDEQNPLVPQQYEEAFRTLQDRVLSWEKEDQADRAGLN